LSGLTGGFFNPEIIWPSPIARARDPNFYNSSAAVPRRKLP